MREKLKSLPLTELKQIAKENHIKNVSTLRKAQLIDVILEKLSPEQAQTPQTQNVQTSDTASSDNDLYRHLLRQIPLIQRQLYQRQILHK